MCWIIQSVVRVTVSISSMFFVFDQFRRWLFRSVVLYRSVVCFSISCEGKYSISCAWYSNSCPFFDQLYKGEFFDQSCLIFNQFCVLSISCKPDFSDQLRDFFNQLLNCDFYSIGGMSDFFDPFLCDQLFVLFNQLYMCLFRSVVFDIQSVVCFT